VTTLPLLIHKTRVSSGLSLPCAWSMVDRWSLCR